MIRRDRPPGRDFGPAAFCKNRVDNTATARCRARFTEEVVTPTGYDLKRCARAQKITTKYLFSNPDALQVLSVKSETGEGAASLASFTCWALFPEKGEAKKVCQNSIKETFDSFLKCMKEEPFSLRPVKKEPFRFEPEPEELQVSPEPLTV